MSKNVIFESSLGMYYRHELTNTYEPKRVVHHSHPQYEIYLLKSGNVEYVISEQSYHINVGELLLVNQNVYHKVIVDKNTAYERFVIQFKPDTIPPLNGIDITKTFFEINPNACIIPAVLVSNSKITDILLDIEKICATDTAYLYHLFLSKLIELSVEINRLIMKMKNTDYTFNYPTNNTPKSINECIQYINNHLSQKFSIDELAEECGISKSRLQHLFKDTVGTTISDYITKQKMQTALFMLNFDKSPTEVAEHLGYEYYSTFCSNFKKVFGFTPQAQMAHNREVMQKRFEAMNEEN